MASVSSTVVLAADLDTDQVKTIGIVAIVAIVVLGLLIARLVTKVVVRVAVLIVMVVLGLAVYQQRDKVTDAANDALKKCDVTFFGIHVHPDDANIKKACDALAQQGSK